MKYLDFENQEKGYSEFHLTRKNINANIGKQIAYVDRRTIDRYRGNYNVEYAIIESVRYSQLFLNEGHDSVDIRNVVECGIK